MNEQLKCTPYIETLTKLRDDLFKERDNPNIDIKRILNLENQARELLKGLYSLRAIKYNSVDQNSRYADFKIEDF